MNTGQSVNRRASRPSRYGALRVEEEGVAGVKRLPVRCGARGCPRQAPALAIGLTGEIQVPRWR